MTGYTMFRGNINRLLMESASIELAEEWERRHASMDFDDLVDFQHRVGMAAYERREKIKEANRKKGHRSGASPVE